MPRTACKIAFLEWTAEQKVLQPVFLGLRDDKERSESVLPQKRWPSPTGALNHCSVKLPWLRDLSFFSRRAAQLFFMASDLLALISALLSFPFLLFVEPRS